MTAFIRSRNLPFSVEDVRTMTKACNICNQCKPRFYVPGKKVLIKATRPMERLNLDFKGPLPSNTTNKYILTVIDEYTRFPFAIPCPDVKTTSVIKALCQIFSIFGLPAYIHSDRGSAFMSSELKQYLHNKGIATSRTTPYNPQWNGLVERYNGTIWKSVSLALKARNLPPTCWEIVLPDALHSIRTLISTATNSTPRERMFNFQRHTTSGISLPTWLSNPGPVLLRNHRRTSKYDPLVKQVELIEANPCYAHIRYQNGVESTVSLKDLAQIDNIVDVSTQNDVVDISTQKKSVDIPTDHHFTDFSIETNPLDTDTPVNVKKTNEVEDNRSNEVELPETVNLRRSTRNRKPPTRLDL